MTDEDIKSMSSITQSAFQTLGGKVLDVIILSKAIWNNVSTSEELDNIRKIKTSNKRLKEIALYYNLQDFVFWSQSQIKEKQWENSNKLLPNTLEAIIGAAFFDRVIDAAEKIVGRFDIYDWESME